MSRRILNAHTGESLATGSAASETQVAVPASGSHILTQLSYEGLRQWISEQTGISDARQVLMTGRGKPVKVQTLRTEVCSLDGRYTRI